MTEANHHRICRIAWYIIITLMLFMVCYPLFLQPRMILWRAQYRLEKLRQYETDQRRIVQDYQEERIGKKP